MSSELPAPALTPDEALAFSGVVKTYRLGAGGAWSGDLRDDVKALVARLLHPGASDERGPQQLRALDGVDLRVRRGENVGLVGPNGAGKTTMLKLISRITRPSAGELWVRGRVAALIQVGAGFHKELTGRENLFLYGSILGLSQRELSERYHDIVAFAELERFMDTPVKRYSNGMFVRLGFSIAVHVEPDILVVDEVLAVGDQAFREKCLERMQAYLASDTTLLFVSHDRELLESVCDRAVLLDEGRVIKDGPVTEVLAAYQSGAVERGVAEPDPARFGGAPPAVELTRVELCDGEGRVTTHFREDNQLRLRVSFTTHQPVEGAAFEVRLTRGLTLVFSTRSDQTSDLRPLDAGHLGLVELNLDALHLLEGQYSVSVQAAVGERGRTARCDNLERVLHFQVKSSADRGAGIVSLGPRWELDS